MKAPCNSHMAILFDWIQAAQQGDEPAIDGLRKLIGVVALHAPPGDLIRIAQTLYDIRQEAAKAHAEEN